MKPRTPLALSLSLAMILIIAGLLQHSTQTRASAMTRSDKLDRAVFDENLPVRTCINLGGALEAPSEGDWGYEIRASDLRRIARAGFDTVRLPVAWSEHAGEQAPYTIPPALLVRTDEIISTALALDLKVILNVHHYWQLMNDPDAHEARFDAIWHQLADHYQDWPDGLVFELLNEPYKKMTPERVNALNRRVLGMIRPSHPTRYVMLGGGWWNSLEGMLKMTPPDDPYLIATFHYYNPHQFTHQGANFTDDAAPTGTEWGSPEELSDLDEVMAAAARFRITSGVPVFLGEFGVYADVPARQRAKWTRQVRLAAEERGIGWCYFDWATTFRIYDLERERWVRPVRQALLP